MFERILVLSAHTDDGELGCGGAIARFVGQGMEVHYVALSACEDTMETEWPRDQLHREVAAATAVLGVPREHLRVLDFQVRHFPQDRQRVLDALIELKADIDPDLVFVPTFNDLHQDHFTLAREGFRAFKDRSLLGYEEPWNNRTLDTAFFITLEQEHVDLKIAALRCYETQAGNDYMSADVVRSLARTRGSQVLVPYAESFEVLRWVMR